MHEALDREFGSRFLQFCKRDLYATSMQMYRFILFGVSQHFWAEARAMQGAREYMSS